jgi:hypothetical protein
MKKLTLSTLAAALVLVSAPAVADPTVAAQKDQGTNSKGSIIGQYSSVYTQNGQIIGGSGGVVDQTVSPGSRGALVQEYLGHTSWPGPGQTPPGF